MASSNDVRDMLGLAAAGEKAAKPPPLKKQKNTHKPLRGMNREVHALIGERAAPVAIIDPSKTYHRKLGPKRKAKQWVQQPFRNPARLDELVLKHWVPKPVAQRQAQDGGDTAMEDAENRNPELDAEVPLDEEYRFARYNVQIETPKYDDEQYNAHLKSEQWSREETDYLLEMVRDYHQRWPVIADRWDFMPRSADATDASKTETDAVKAEPTDAEVPNSTDSTGVNSSQPSQALAKTRTVEELKHRYYNVSAALMALHHPVSNMNDAEFALHSTLTSYDPIQETTRKKLAASMLARGIDELKEEEYLIAELQRIMTSQHRLEAERAELRARLETAPQLRTMEGDFSSSAALNELFQRLINSSRSAKRSAQGGGPSGRLSLSAGDMLPSPAYGGVGTPMSAHARDSFGNKRGSTSLGGVPGSAGGLGASVSGAPLRQPSPKTERRFGISAALDVKGNQGVSFPTDRISKARQAKSAVQTTKLYEALQSLKIPEVLPLPTVEVVEAFEELVGKITRVNDARRVLEREEGDVRVVRNRRRESGVDAAAGDDEDEDADADGDVTMASAANDEEDAPGEDDEEEEEEEATAVAEDEEEEDEEDADAEGEVDDYQDAEEGGEEDAEGEEDEEEEEAEEDDAEGEDDDEGVEDEDAEGEDEESGLGETANGVSQANGTADLVEGEDEDEDEDAEEAESERPQTGSTRPGTAVSHTSVSTRASRKRSASVLSGGSAATTKRTRR